MNLEVSVITLVDWHGGTRMQPFNFSQRLFGLQDSSGFKKQCFTIYGCENPGGTFVYQKLV